jgi:ribosomal protein L37AE/L43A
MLKTDKTCSCGNTTHERTLTEDFKFVWECTECHKQFAYRNTILKKNQKFHEVEVTTPQKKTLTKLHKDILEHDGEGYEHKAFILDEGSRGSYFITSITGKPHDEGTIDYLTSRNTRHIFLGERGDLEISSGGEKITDYQEIISIIS